MNLAVATTVILFPALSFAQFGSVAGVVRDDSGSSAPGVRVEAASPVLIEKVRTAVSDESGQYRVEQLRPGTYSVTFKLSGFNTVRLEGMVCAKWLFLVREVGAARFMLLRTRQC